MIGRIDVHSHLLPGIDDGCETLAESLLCARELVRNGYTHSFCTPHFWPSFPGNTVVNIAKRVMDLQHALDEAGIPLTLMAGGELGMRAGLLNSQSTDLPTYAGEQRYLLFDFWDDCVPKHVMPTVEWIRSFGIQPILAHPERIGCFQRSPELVPRMIEQGVLFQGNLQCQSDRADSITGKLARSFLDAGYYFMLGSDLHRIDSLGTRMNGLRQAIERVGEEEVDRLTRLNPMKLLRSGFGTITPATKDGANHGGNL